MATSSGTRGGRTPPFRTERCTRLDTRPCTIVVITGLASGVRLEECLALRVKDLDFDRRQIIVRQGKGQKDRVTMLPAAAREGLTGHLADVRRLHERDLARGFGRVVLPFALGSEIPQRGD
jgi:integrase